MTNLNEIKEWDKSKRKAKRDLNKLKNLHTITVQQFVQREVIHNISSLISELVKDEKYSEELFAVCVQDEWENAAKEEGWEDCGLDEWGCHFFKNEDGSTWASADWCDLCVAQGIDPHQNEALEHWIVTDWLAEKLEAKGEMILKDFMNLTIWGRTCSGQAIMVDSVIGEIYTDLTGFKPEY